MIVQSNLELSPKHCLNAFAFFVLIVMSPKETTLPYATGNTHFLSLQCDNRRMQRPYKFRPEKKRAPKNHEEAEMVRDRGFEPLTPSVSRKCSTTELTALPLPKDCLRTFVFHSSFGETDGEETRASARPFQA
jgi:hypothetical protein